MNKLFVAQLKLNFMRKVVKRIVDAVAMRRELIGDTQPLGRSNFTVVVIIVNIVILLLKLVRLHAVPQL